LAGALSAFRICDFTGQLAGAGATKWMASFGAEVIRIEDPVQQGRWDILRGNPPFKEGQAGLDYGGAFNNHNVNKLGITLNLRTEQGKEILTELIRQSDVVCENFAKGVMARWGFDYEAMKAIKPDIIYVSNCGFGQQGPYSDFKTWGPIVQAVSGLTFSSALKDKEPAGWGYSYMDHTGAYYMAMAILMALFHRERTGEGQWVDMSCTDTALTLHGPAILDWTVNNRPLRRDGQPDSNRELWPPMVPHGIYPCQGEDNWLAIACEDDQQWQQLCAVSGLEASTEWSALSGRISAQNQIDQLLASWTTGQDKVELSQRLQQAGVAAAPVYKPRERIDEDPNTGNFGLWSEVEHSAMGKVRVDGQPVHFSRTDWDIKRGGPCLGEHNAQVLMELLGYSAQQVEQFRAEGVI